jgi:hypothetical protein
MEGQAPHQNFRFEFELSQIFRNLRGSAKNDTATDSKPLGGAYSGLRLHLPDNGETTVAHDPPSGALHATG